MKNLVKLSLLAAMAVAPVMADESFGGIGVTIYQIHEGVKVADDMGKTKVLMASSHLSTVIYVQPHSQRLHDAMMQRYGQDIREPIKEALEKALKTDKVQQESVQKNKEIVGVNIDLNKKIINSAKICGFTKFTL